MSEDPERAAFERGLVAAAYCLGATDLCAQLPGLLSTHHARRLLAALRAESREVRARALAPALREMGDALAAMEVG